MDKMIGKSGETRPKLFVDGSRIRDAPIYNKLMLGDGYYVAIPGNDDPRNYKTVISRLKATLPKKGDKNEPSAKADNKDSSR